MNFFNVALVFMTIEDLWKQIIHLNMYFIQNEKYEEIKEKNRERGSKNEKKGWGNEIGKEKKK